MSTNRFPLLCLDTSANALELGLALNETQWAYQLNEVVSLQRSQSSLLIPKLQQALSDNGISPKELKSIAVNTGPGSFTGLRAALTCARSLLQFLPRAKGYCFNRFDLIAAQLLKEENNSIQILIDARRGKAYGARIGLQNQELKYESPPSLIDIETLESNTLTMLCVSGSLKAGMPERFTKAHTLEDLKVWTPQAMRTLILSNPEHYQVQNYQELEALYLQSPNITLRKKAGKN